MEEQSKISRRSFIKGIGTFALAACLPPQFAIEAAAKVIPAPPTVVANALSFAQLQRTYLRCLREPEHSPDMVFVNKAIYDAYEEMLNEYRFES